MAGRFRRYMESPLTLHRQSLTEVWVAITRDRDGVLDLFTTYVEEAVCADLPVEAAAAVRSAARYDAATFPLMDDEAHEREAALDGSYLSAVSFDHDILRFVRGDDAVPQSREATYEITHRAGLWRYPVSNWYFGLASFQADLVAIGSTSAVTVA